MSRITFIVFLLTGIVYSGCRTNGPQARAAWQKYCLVKEGMTDSEVYALEPAPTLIIGEKGENQMVAWKCGSSLANEDYASMTILFGKDGRVQTVDRERGH